MRCNRCERFQGFRGALFQRRLLAAAATSVQSLEVYITKDYNLWLVNNSSTEDIQLKPTELFGFGLGSYSSELSGEARSKRSQWLPFLISSDKQIVVDDKVPMPFAELVCQNASRHGLMDVVLADHNMTSKEDGFLVLCTEGIKPESKTNQNQFKFTRVACGGGERVCHAFQV